MNVRASPDYLSREAAPMRCDAIDPDEPEREPVQDCDGSGTEWLWSRGVAQSIEHGDETLRRLLPAPTDASDVIDSLVSGFGHGSDYGRSERRALDDTRKRARRAAPPILDAGQDWRSVVVNRWSGLDRRSRT